MNTNFQITIETFKSLNDPIQPLQKPCLFTKLFKSKDNKVIKKKVFETKKEWLTWKNSITHELLNQRILSQKYPGKVLTILNYTVQTINQQRNVYITYDCEDDIEPLFRYLNNNHVSFQELAQIFEQLLQIICILFKSQFEHTNLKPNNILYYKKQVLITDFGSARTHYQNFLKEYTAQAEKEWQNNLIFFYPQEYQKIMDEDNLYFRNDQWNEFDISDQKFRKYIDIWALSMMMIQVFENNQTLPNKLTDYYGLNQKLLLQKIENLKQYSNGIYSEAIYSLLIEKKDPEQVYQKFLQQKKQMKTESPQQIESTYTVQQIFDDTRVDDHMFPSYKPEVYFLAKQAIQNIQDQFDDHDALSVISSNNQIDLINFNEIKQKNNLTEISFQQIQNHNNNLQSPKKFISQNQLYEFTQNNSIFNLQDNKSNQNNHNQQRPSIVVTNYDFNQQQIQGVNIDDTQNQNFNNILPQNQSGLQIISNKTEQHYSNNLLEIQDDQEMLQHIINKKNNNNKIQLGNLQSIQLNQIDDHEQVDDITWSPNFKQNGTQTFQFLEAQKLDNVTQNNKNVNKDSVSFINFENFQVFQQNNENLLNLEDEQKSKDELSQFQGKKENQNQVQQFAMLAIDDFDQDEQQQQLPKDNRVQKQLKQTDGLLINLNEIDDSQKVTNNQKRDSQQTNQLIIVPTTEQIIPFNDNPKQDNNQIQFKVEQNNFNITEPSLQLLQQVNQNITQIQPESNSQLFSHIISEEIGEPLLFVDEEQGQTKNKGKNSIIQHLIKDDKMYQQAQQFYDPEEIIKQESNQHPITLEVIQNKINQGVLQLQDADQKEILDQLKIISKIFNQLEEENVDQLNNFEDENDQKTKKQKQQFYNEIVIQNGNQQVQLINDVNDTIGIIKKKQEADNLFENGNIEKNPLLLTYLNEDQLKQLKQQTQGNKILNDQIQKMLEVKEDFLKFKKNPKVENLLKKQQIELLNKEELKIYLKLIEKLPKEYQLKKQLIEQKLAAERKLKEIKQKEEEQLIEQKLIDFLKDPTFDKLLPTDQLKLLNNEEKQQYKAALKNLQLKSTSRQQKSIQDQMNQIKDNLTKVKNNKSQIKQIDEVSNEGSTRQSSKQNKQVTFQDAYYKAFKQLNDNNQINDILSKNYYIREFQLKGTAYVILDPVPKDCQDYQLQLNNRKVQFFDFQGSKYKGETLNNCPDGIGILRKRNVSSIYQGYFRLGKFYWGQVLEMNGEGLLTQYVGYYNQQYELKHGKARLKWFKPLKRRFCGECLFIEYEMYEGDFVIGYIHGIGKKIYADQSEYEGEWKKNKRVGQGRLTLKQGGRKYLTYEGQFQDDVQHGKQIKAIHHHQTGCDLIVQGEYKKGKPIGQHQLIFNDIIQREIIY